MFIRFFNSDKSISSGVESKRHKTDQTRIFLETIKLIIANKMEIKGSNILVLGIKYISKADITIPID